MDGVDLSGVPAEHDGEPNTGAAKRTPGNRPGRRLEAESPTLNPFNMHDRGRPEQPEVRLWQAAIFCCIDDLRNQTNKKRRAAAEKWIKSRERHVKFHLDVPCNRFELQRYEAGVIGARIF